MLVESLVQSLCYIGCASFCSKGEVMLKQFRVRNNMVRYFTHAMKQFNLFSFVSVVCVIAKDWYQENIGNMDFFSSSSQTIDNFMLINSLKPVKVS